MVTTHPSPASGVRHVRPGEDAAVDPRSWRAQIGWHDPRNTLDVDVIALLLRPDGRVGADSDMVFHNQ
jgi:stress response protein SCP2